MFLFCAVHGWPNVGLLPRERVWYHAVQEASKQVTKQLEQLITLSSRVGLPGEPLMCVKLSKLVGSIPAQDPPRPSVSVPNLASMGTPGKGPPANGPGHPQAATVIPPIIHEVIPHSGPGGHEEDGELRSSAVTTEAHVEPSGMSKVVLLGEGADKVNGAGEGPTAQGRKPAGVPVVR